LITLVIDSLDIIVSRRWTLCECARFFGRSCVRFWDFSQLKESLKVLAVSVVE